MRIKRLLMAAALIGIMFCYGCGDKDAKPATTETSVSQETASASTEASTSEAASVEETSNSETSVSEIDPYNAEEAYDYYGEVTVTGIEDWNCVGYSIAGFMDGSLFQLQYVDENGTEINGDYTPGAPDKIVFEFDPETGEVVSATYFGTYPDEEAAGMGVEAFSANADLLGDDVIGLSVVGTTEIMVAFDPHSARFNNTIRTYFLEGHQDPEGYTKAVEKDHESSTLDKSKLKGDNFACDAIQGLKVTWYK